MIFWKNLKSKEYEELSDKLLKLNKDIATLQIAIEKLEIEHTFVASRLKGRKIQEIKESEKHISEGNLLTPDGNIL